jgi:hypothetical protein
MENGEHIREANALASNVTACTSSVTTGVLAKVVLRKGRRLSANSTTRVGYPVESVDR